MRNSASWLVRKKIQNPEPLGFILSLTFISSQYYCDPTLGLPDDVIQRGRDYKMVTEVTQSGNDFVWTQHYPSNHKVTNNFTIGKECDMQTIAGKKFKVGK